MLPDDHEYWNNYPFYKSAIPTLQALRVEKVRDTWEKAASDGVNNVQCSTKVDHFSIAKDLSFCLADVRSNRGKNVFISKANLAKVSEWASTLKSPGVLVLSQSLVVDEMKGEKNLRSFSGQYQQLLQALAVSGHDIVLMTGDVHFGRISSAALGNKGARLIEIISSPLSNLTGLNGIATNKANTKPRKFPDRSTAKSLGWKSRRVNYYDKKYAVETQKGSIFSPYVKTRTKEHFMTIGFNRSADGFIELKAKVWLVRERSGSRQLPTNGFRSGKKHFKMKLK